MHVIRALVDDVEDVPAAVCAVDVDKPVSGAGLDKSPPCVVEEFPHRRSGRFVLGVRSPFDSRQFPRPRHVILPDAIPTPLFQCRLDNARCGRCA